MPVVCIKLLELFEQHCQPRKPSKGKAVEFDAVGDEEHDDRREIYDLRGSRFQSLNQSVDIGEGNCRIRICDHECMAGDFGAVRGEKAGFEEEMRESDVFSVNKILEDV